MGNAHRSVNKSLDLHLLRDVLPDLFQLIQGQFSGCHHPGCSLRIPEIVGRVVGAVGLGADMYVDLRADFPGDGEHTRIRDDQRIRLHLL